MSVRSLIIVPVDDAPETEAIVAYAASIARTRGAEMHAVQVVPRKGGLWAAPQRELKLRARLRAVRTSAEVADVSLRVVTLRGAPVRALSGYARREAASLIVVRSHYGTSRLWRSTRVTAKLARIVPVPVVVVPRRAAPGKPGSLKRIVVSIDSSVASALALRTATNLARTHGAHLTIFHAFEEPERLVFTGGEAWRLMERLSSAATGIAQRLEQHASRLGVTAVEAVVVTGDAHRGIVETASRNAADLIVMGAAPRSWFDQAAFGSTVRAVLRRARTPVLVLPVVADAPASLEYLQELVRHLEGASAADPLNISAVGRRAA